MTGTFDAIPTENLRFDEMPPEIADMAEAVDTGDETADMMVNLMGQMLSDIEELSVSLTNAHSLLSQMHAALSTLGRKDYPAAGMVSFLESADLLLDKIASTYVPEG